MQDLLNEEEFIEKKTDYNPWRGFGVFYGIAFVTVILLFIAVTSAKPKDADILMAMVLFGAPLIIAFAMVFSTGKMRYCPIKYYLLLF